MGRLVGIAKREAKRADMEILEDAEISEQTGVANDFRGKPGKRQVTLVSASICMPRFSNAARAAAEISANRDKALASQRVKSESLGIQAYSSRVSSNHDASSAASGNSDSGSLLMS